MSSAPTNPDRTEQRLDRLEQDVGQLQVDVAGIKARLDTEFPAIRREMATKADVETVRTAVERMGRLMIMWSVGTVIAMAGLVFAIVRYTA